MQKVLLFVFMAVFIAESYGQISASANFTSRARIIDPIRIDKTLDLDFGNVISSYTAGSVTLSPDGSRSAQGVEISSSIKGNVNPAEAVVTHGSSSYAITLPDKVTLYNESNRDKIMIIDQFAVESEEGESVDVLKIGATLHLEADQASGFYTNSAGFNVTVSYN